MRFATSSITLLTLVSALGLAPSWAIAGDPATPAEVTVVGKSRGGGESSFTVAIDGKFISQDVYFNLLELDDKTLLISIIDFKKLKGDTDEKKEEAAREMQKFAEKGKRVAIKGRLVPESKEVSTGVLRIRDKEVLTLKDKKQLILLAESITEVDDKNKDRFPVHGKTRVEGLPQCGKADLKLFDEPTLAIANGSVPIILEGAKSKAKAGKALIRVIGQLKVDDKGLLRLVADEVAEVGK